VIRFAWLQFRMQAALTAAALTIVAVVLVLTGLNLAHLYDTTVASCAAHHDCSAATTSFTAADGPLQVFSDFLLVIPLASSRSAKPWRPGCARTCSPRSTRACRSPPPPR
jgi:hypothetical protein